MARLGRRNRHHSDAHGNGGLEVFEHNRRFDDAANMGRDRCRIFDASEAFAHDHELVTARAGDSVGSAESLLEPARHLDQDAIAAFVPDTVIDNLERIEVAEQHGHDVLRPGGARERDGEAIHDEQSIRETGERVVQAQVDQLGFRRFPFGHVSSIGDDSSHCRVLEAVRVDRLEPAPHPALAADAQLRGRLRDVGREQPRDLTISNLQIDGMDELALVRAFEFIRSIAQRRPHRRTAVRQHPLDIAYQNDVV